MVTAEKRGDTMQEDDTAGVALSLMPYCVYAAPDTRKLGVKPYYMLLGAFRRREDAKLFIKAAKERGKDSNIGSLYKIVDFSPKEDEV